MESNPLRPRGVALEDAYIRQLETQRLQRQRAAGDRERMRAELAAELEVDGADLLDALLDLGVSAATAAAFEALPLVEVAWADGDVDEAERWSVLARASAFGLDLGMPAHAQLELWLTRKPAPELFELWYRLAAARRVRPGTPTGLDHVIQAARDVAMAAGGILGLGGVSRSERAVLQRVGGALGHSPTESA